MPSTTNSDPASVHRALASSVRRRLLDVLTDADEARTVQELAVALDLHVTTVRWHLDHLEGAGLVTSAVRPSGAPGRPPRAWAAVAAPAPSDTDGASYQLLAQILVDGLTDSPSTREGSTWAQQLGERWAPRLLAAMDLYDEQDPMGAVVAAFDELGFAPKTTSGAIHLHACPFADLAEGNEDVVCDLHLGMARAMLREVEADVTVGSLEPFVEPSLCVLSLIAP